MLTSDEDDDDDDDGDEVGSSDDSDSEDDIDGPMGFDSDDGVLLSDSSDYEASDDETPLMKLVSSFDALHAWISTSSATALSALQDVATLPVAVEPLHGSDVDKRPRSVEGGGQKYDPGTDYQLPYHSGPAEMPYHQRVMTQSFMQHPATPAQGTTLRSRAIQLIQQQQQQEQQQLGLIGGGGRYGILGSVFRYLTRQQAPDTLIGAAAEPERLLSRRDFVNDWTVKTILDQCPGLCKLTLSECHGITDRSLELIGDSACVAARTLVSLHLAGCSQITDHCDNITSTSVVALANHCPNTEWLDLCRTGVLTEECLILLAERCTDLEWLNLARVSPGVLESSLDDGLGSGSGAEGDNTNNGGTGGGIDSAIDGEAEIEQDNEEEFINVDNEKIPDPADGDRLVKEETSTETEDRREDQEEEEKKVKEDSITDRALALLCESCPNLQLLDLSYISTISNTAMESLSETAKSLVCLTIIGCPGITSQSLLYLARLRNNSGKLGCITMGDALGISERDIEQIMQGTLSGWQKSLVDETNLGEILGRSWDE
ncbi:hypothetical protein BGZ90_004410 [Linnemannia elongata]|nr:hypothetical protein BGZ90_004410 [Linnemannia elongata]